MRPAKFPVGLWSKPATDLEREIRVRLSLLITASCLLGSVLESGGAADASSQYQREEPPSTLMQASLSEGGLPVERYQELRTETLAHPSLRIGPKTKNPHISMDGLDSAALAALAQQRAYRKAHGGIAPSLSGDSGLLPRKDPTLLSSSPSDPELLAKSTPSALPQHPRQTRNFCAGPAIRAVNGKSTNAIFTPTEPDNHFRIEGCGFGLIPGAVQLRPSLHSLAFGIRTPPIPLELETTSSWSDEGIDVYLNASLTGVPDFPADLVVELAGGREVQLPGCFFVAARGEPQLLKTIPAAWVKLDATFASTHPIRQLEYVSPPVIGDEIPLEAVGSSALVVRSDQDPFSAGRDTYDFSQLAPGWVVESVQLNEFSVSCPRGERPAESKGAWMTTWDPHGFTVGWVRQTCSSSIPPVFKFIFNASQYSAKVWVVGPAGTEPLRRGF